MSVTPAKPMHRASPLACLAISALLAASAAGAQRPAARDSACVTVVNETGRSAVPGARIMLSTPEHGSSLTAFADASGRACLAARDSTQLRVEALGFGIVNIALGTKVAPPARMYPVFGEAMDEEWARSQITAALFAMSRRVEVQADDAALAIAMDVLRQAESAALPVTLTKDSTGNLLLAYVDLTRDGSRTGEIRLRFTGRDAIVLGVTVTRCGEACAREFDLAMSWVPRAGAGWQPQQLVRADSSGTVLRVAIDTAVPEQPTTVGPPARRMMVTVRGVVRDDTGAPIAGIEVYSADGSSTAETNVKGEYELALVVPPGGALLTTRRIGWAPQFRTVRVQEGGTATWSPVLTSTAVLSRQLVTATGVPDILRSIRYEGFLARRARGVGQFFITEEIWSAVSLGDMLNRARGFRAKVTYGNRLGSIYVPSCGLNQTIGVFVDGQNETGVNTGENSAEGILSRYVTSAIVGMELYRGRTEMPPEFADPRYCAVIALWTR